MTLAVAGLTLTVSFSAWWLTGRVRRYAVASRLIDVPNARSSHVMATPRGGGVAIVIAVLTGLLVAGLLGAIPWRLITGLAGSGAVVAGVGFADDHGHVARRWRLLAHGTAAVWVLVWVGGLPPLPILGHVVTAGWIANGLAGIYIVWLLNLTNFMDGIDGLAAVEAITVCLCGALLYQTSAPGESHWVAPLILAGGASGFLIWNWPPAKIFMGDAGSGFLGLMLAGLSLQAAWVAPQLFWSWLILLGVFVVDATFTLVRRTLRGDRFYNAHRTHAYQHAARAWGSHRPVTVAISAINLGWLLPVAYFVARNELTGLPAVLIAYAPLVAAAVWLGAGRAQSSADPPAAHI